MKDLSEAIGETGRRGMQRLRSAATGDADGVRDDLGHDVVDHLNYGVDHLGDAAQARPTEYGAWETAYTQRRLWCATGLWPPILAEVAP